MSWDPSPLPAPFFFTQMAAKGLVPGKGFQEPLATLDLSSLAAVMMVIVKECFSDILKSLHLQQAEGVIGNREPA